MKLFLVMLVLITMGYYIQQSRLQSRGSVAKVENNADELFFCAPSFDPSQLGDGEAPIFKGLGNLHYAVTTSSARAQEYFNQGLTLLYAFNHGEAGRSFKAAIQLDSSCAMAYWGLVMVLGPNYNAALNPSSLSDINYYLKKAEEHAANAKPNEQALIKAVRERFPTSLPVADMAPFNTAYAQAMFDAYRKFPEDVEIAVLYAEALMNEHPWNLWLKNGTPQPWTPKIIDLLESILKKYPEHPGAIHYYLHAMEASADAKRALPAADKLPTLLPAAGHLMHMPAHIYIRTGHYHKGVLTTEKARKADSNYIAQCKVQGTYPLLYYPHNTHFLAACAFLEGNSRKAIAAAQAVSDNADRRYLREIGTVQHYYNIPYYVFVHLAEWEKIMALNDPGDTLKYPQAIWHYARGVARLAKGEQHEAEKELIQLKKIGEDKSLKKLLIWETNSAADLVYIATCLLEGELAASRMQYDEALTFLRKAVEKENVLNYQEPPDWFFSTRHTLGNVLVQAGIFNEAEKVYKEDLAILPENGWSLIGLYNSLKGQGKIQEANDAKQRFDKAWRWADIKIDGSRIY